PSRDSFFARPCTRPAVFHHLLPAQLQALHDIDSRYAHEPSLANLFAALVADPDLAAAEIALAAAAADEDYSSPARNPPVAAAPAGAPRLLRLPPPPDTNSGATAAYPPSGPPLVVVFADADAPGSDFARQPAASPTDCAVLCAMRHADPPCVAWSHVSQDCWLKDAYTPRTARAGATSGYLPERFACRHAPPTVAVAAAGTGRGGLPGNGTIADAGADAAADSQKAKSPAPASPPRK
ncbi:hypothetical protein HK405_006067, partial [Cladochytrium tenue]